MIYVLGDDEKEEMTNFAKSINGWHTELGRGDHNICGDSVLAHSVGRFGERAFEALSGLEMDRTVGRTDGHIDFSNTHGIRADIKTRIGNQNRDMLLEDDELVAEWFFLAYFIAPSIVEFVGGIPKSRFWKDGETWNGAYIKVYRTGRKLVVPYRMFIPMQRALRLYLRTTG